MTRILSNFNANLKRLSWNGLSESWHESDSKTRVEFQSVMLPHVSCKILTAQKMKFSIKDFFSKSDQICRKLRIWSHLLKKSFMENFVFCAVCGVQKLMSHWNCPFLARTGISFQNSLHIFKLLIMFDLQYWKCNNICSAWKVKEKLKISWFFILWLRNFLFFSKNFWHPPPWKKIDPLQNQNFLTPSRVFSKSFNVPPQKPFSRGVCMSCSSIIVCSINFTIIQVNIMTKMVLFLEKKNSARYTKRKELTKEFSHQSI